MFSQKRISIKESGDSPSPPMKQQQVNPMVDSTREEMMSGTDMVRPIEPTFPATDHFDSLDSFYATHPTIDSSVSHFPSLHPEFQCEGSNMDPGFQYLPSDVMPDFHVTEADAAHGKELPNFTASIYWSSMMIRRYIQKSAETSDIGQPLQPEWRENNPTIVCCAKEPKGPGNHNPLVSRIHQNIPKRKSLVGEAFFPPEFYVEMPSTLLIAETVGQNLKGKQQEEVEVARSDIETAPDADPLSKTIPSPTYGVSSIGFGIDEACHAIIGTFDIIQ